MWWAKQGRMYTQHHPLKHKFNASSYHQKTTVLEGEEEGSPGDLELSSNVFTSLALFDSSHFILKICNSITF